MPDVVPGGTSTPYTLTLGTAVSGTIDTEADQDWYRISLTAGQTYIFQLWGSSFTPLWDSFLGIYSLTGQLVTTDDDGALFYNGGTWTTTRNSQLTFTPSVTGLYYISAQAFQAISYDNIGSYTLTAAVAGSFASLTTNQIADYLTGGYWVAADLRDGVARNDGPRAFAGHTITVNLTQLDVDGLLLARAALAAWEQVCNIDFVETTNAGAQISFAPDASTTRSASTSSNITGTIINYSSVDINRAWLDYYGTSLSSYSFQTYVHEIGHAIGLGHAGPYNGSATYGLHNIYADDSWAYSVMSYMDQAESGYGTYHLLGGPQIADIVAAQTLYGISHSAAVGDFDGDGRNDDVLWHNSSTGSVAAWFLSSGQATQSVTTWSATLDWQIVGVGDFDGDGRNDDLLWRNDNSGTVATWFLSNGQATQSVITWGASLDWQIAGIGDFDGDGRNDDVLWRNSNTGTVATWFLSNGQATQSVITWGASLDWQIAGVGDFDGDGRNDDVLWRNDNTGTVATWFLSNGQATQSVITWGASLEWQIAGIGDFDGDGRNDDILWRNINTGTVATWFMSNGQATQSVITWGASPNWQIEGVGDFDGDGRRDDILWHDSQSGAVSTWLLSNGAATQSTGTWAASLDWRIA